MHVLVVTYRSPLESIVIAAPEKKTDVAASQSHVLNLLVVIFFFPNSEDLKCHSSLNFAVLCELLELKNLGISLAKTSFRLLFVILRF